MDQIKEAGIYPRFYKKAVRNEGKTLETGYPQFDEREFVEITIAGDNKTQIDKPVSDRERQRWPTVYKAFVEEGKQIIEGFPIEQWPLLSLGQVEKLKFISVRTVEQLAGLDDNGLSAYGPGGRDLQNQAKAFIDKATDSKDYSKLASENDSMKADIEMLKKQLSDKDKLIEKLKKK